MHKYVIYACPQCFLFLYLIFPIIAFQICRVMVWHTWCLGGKSLVSSSIPFVFPFPVSLNFEYQPCPPLLCASPQETLPTAPFTPLEFSLGTPWYLQVRVVHNYEHIQIQFDYYRMSMIKIQLQCIHSLVKYIWLSYDYNTITIQYDLCI